MRRIRMEQLFGLLVVSSMLMSSVVLQAHSGRHPEISALPSKAGSSEAVNQSGTNIRPPARVSTSAEPVSLTHGRLSQTVGESATAPTLIDPGSVIFADNFDSENGGNGDLNYFGLANWNVTAGSVDLIGNGFADFLPGHGLYLDLDGTTFAAGTLESKPTFTLVPATYRLEFSLAGSQLGQANRVDVRLGDVYSESFTLESDVPFTTITRDIVVSTETSGKLVFQAFGNDNIGLLLDNVRLLTDITEPLLFNLSPDHGGNTGSVTVNLSGINFPAGPVTAKLSAPGQPEIAAVSAAVISATQIVATFDLTGAGLGLRDAVVTFPGGLSLTRQDAFTVEPGSAPEVWVAIIGRSTIRPGRPQTFTIVYGNRGNTDAYGVPLWVAGIPKSADVSVKTALTPPPEEAGVPPLDWSQVPEFVETASEKRVPLFLPVVPPDTTGAVNIAIQSNSELNFQLQTWANPPVVKSLEQDSLAVTECGLAVTREILNIAGLIPGVSCLEATRQFILDQYLHAVKDAVHERRTGESENPVMSLTEMSVDFVYLGGRCLGGELPGSTIWEFGKVVIGGLEAFAACQEPFRRLSESGFPVTTVFSRDPNDKVGALGVGSQRYVSGREPLRYVIFFENIPTATAPAQDVVITDHLDVLNLQLNTFDFGTIGFGDKQVTSPLGVTDFTTDIDLRPGRNLIVKVHAHLDTGTGLLTWSFISIDPATGLPTEDPLAGFLHPGEEGNVAFTVSPKSDLPTGAVISNGASIVFDTNAAIATPAWSNTLDNSTPASSVHALTATACSANLNVQWSGTDTGSGISSYTVYVSDNGGPFTIWQSNTTGTSGNYSGQFGHTYAFYSVAQDKAGNFEKHPVNPDANVTLSTPAPPTFTSVPPAITVYTGQGATACRALVSNAALGVAAAQSACPAVNVTRSGVPSGNLFPVGITTITYTATDGAGRTATATQKVTVIDNTLPVITLNGRTITLWSPNHKYETVRVADLVARASDNCDAALVLGKVVIAQVSSDEADNGSGDGDSSNDIIIAQDCKSVQLRAERDGKRNGRVYTITFKVRDASGRVGTATGKVTVPKSQNGKPAVDDGPNHTIISNCP